MKITALLAAGLIAATAAIPATAQMHSERTTTRTIVHTERHTGGYNRRTHRVCKVTYRHHHRIRTCRTVRY